jgi:hypothetical protein
LIVFIVYAVALLTLLYGNGFFHVFSDPGISRKKMSLLFLGKLCAVPVFYVIYQKMYGGIAKFDTGKFYNDVQVICEFAKKDPLFYLRLLFGLQDDHPGSSDYVNCLKNTVNWDNGTVKDYLYNDNRIVIRVHTLFNFIAFGSYQAHALFSCFLSFTGIFFLYKTFKELFVGKEIYFMIILCFFPALWFYTGALLKEGLCLFVMGTAVFQIRRAIQGPRTTWNALTLLFLLFISCLLKPYLIIFFLALFSLFFILLKYCPEKKRVVVFGITVVILLLLANASSIFLKDRSLSTAALQHQKRFENVSRGGIFLTDSENFMQLKPDTSLIIKGARPNFVRIRKDVPYMYWLPEKPADTLYCKANKDTLSEYQLIYYIPLSGSNIVLDKRNTFTLITSALYYTFLHPFFHDGRNPLQILASFENLVLMLSILLILIGFIQKHKPPFFPIVCLIFAVGISLLVGISAPNSGAIFRYRAPADVFLLLAALYYFPFKFRLERV